jgi:ADP-heptose:LPS heptosyltransferase
MTKILIIRFSSIGDIVLTTPVVRNLKQQLPHCTIHYCTRSQYAELLQNNPYIDKVFSLQSSLKTLADSLQKEAYDYVLDLHHNFRTLKLKTLMALAWQGGKTAYVSFNKLNVEKWLYVNFKLDTMPAVHIVDRYMETTQSLGIINDKQGLDFFISPTDEVPLNTLPASHQQGYVAYAMGAQHYTKKLPLPKMIELCQQINAPIVLLGDQYDAPNAQAIANYFASTLQNSQKNNANIAVSKVAIYNACGKYTLNQSASLLKNAKVVFAHDTGLMHIAAALKKKVYSIWGNTTPQLGMYPYQTAYVVLENKNAKCRPCSKIGFDACPKQHFDCMNGIKFDFEAI